MTPINPDQDKIIKCTTDHRYKDITYETVIKIKNNDTKCFLATKFIHYAQKWSSALLLIPRSAPRLQN
jgi:hypothetical protein